MSSNKTSEQPVQVRHSIYWGNGRFLLNGIFQKCVTLKKYNCHQPDTYSINLTHINLKCGVTS